MKNSFCYFGLLALLTVVGCATETSVPPVAQPDAGIVVEEAPPYVAQVNTVETANPVAGVNHEAFKQVILDGFQAQWVSVQDVRRSVTNDGYARIQVFVKNNTQASIRTRYRFNWQDGDGVDVVDPDHAGWEKLTLIPGDDGVFTSIAPRKDCKDFKLRMKYIP